MRGVCVWHNRCNLQRRRRHPCKLKSTATPVELYTGDTFYRSSVIFEPFDVFNSSFCVLLESMRTTSGKHRILFTSCFIVMDWKHIYAIIKVPNQLFCFWFFFSHNYLSLHWKMSLVPRDDKRFPVSHTLKRTQLRSIGFQTWTRPMEI